MARNRTKTIALLAGLVAVVVLLLVGARWRQIHDALYPEERLFGRWEVVEHAERGEPLLAPWFIEFRRTGELNVEMKGQSGGLRIMRVNAQYRVDRTSIEVLYEAARSVFERRPSNVRLRVGYRFDDDGRLALLYPGRRILWVADGLTMRRVADEKR